MTPDALADLHRRCFVTPRPWRAAEFRDLLAAPGVALFAGAHGFALGRIIAGEAELLTLAVDPDHRRQGHARALLARFEAAALHGAAERTFLEVSAANRAAIGLYRSAGYLESGRRAGYYRDPDGAAVDAVLMEKRLAGG